MVIYMDIRKKGSARSAVILGGILVVVILVLGTLWTGRSASDATGEAVHTVSLFYLDELAGRREQVVAYNLSSSIRNIQTAVGIMDKEDLSDSDHLQAFQTRMKELYDLEKFAFVDTDGLIYTSSGTQEGIEEYSFDYRTLSSPEISVKNLESQDKKVIIAVPVRDVSFGGKQFSVCFMEISMERLLEGVSMRSDARGSTFCNIYTDKGVALTNLVLGGLASEDNLLEAMEHADFDEGYTVEKMEDDFKKKQEGVVSFTYGGIRESMYYVPVEGTDWMLTYLIRESVLTDQFSSISNGIVMRSLLLSGLTAVVLLGMFGFMLVQMRRSAQLALEKETSEAENRIKQEELEQRLVLQEQLLEEEKRRVQQDEMITAMASDYRSVYHVDLDRDLATCIRSDGSLLGGKEEGESFAYLETFRDYADRYVAKDYQETFLQFVDPAQVRAGLKKETIISCRYLVHRGDQETYEMLRMADVGKAEDKENQGIHTVGVGFSNIDAEMRDSMARARALSDALTAAEEANKAKTAFLSSMSHEIRTPMNAIIGLDNIALHEPGISDRMREYLEKIGGSAEHLLNIINDILDMSRIDSGRMTIRNEEFSFSRLLEQVNTMISGQCRDKGLEYQCRIKGEVDDYYIGDDMKLRQVIINILGNAVKFTPAGGTVEFTVERVAQFEKKSTLRFTMRDTGIGMDRDFLPKLFEAFSQEDSSSTSRYGSTGLGMAITKNIVDLMNGKIEVESEKGAGTTFTVTVTLLDAEDRTREGADEEIRPHEMSVLVVDDDPVACQHARLVLEKAGIASEIAGSGAEAIEMVRLRHARRAPYNLILVDWQMPGMDGVETTRRIREIVGSASAIIILTAYRWDDIQDEAMEAGVDCFISKPLFAANVLEEFRIAMKRKRTVSGEQEVRADLQGRRILLAEDVQINAEIIVMLLNVRGVEVDHAENGLKAVEMFSGHPAGYYDAVLMDMRMPEMDGLTAATTIRAMKDHPDAKDIPIIALTANAFDEDVQRSLQAGLNAHLSKPVDPENLYETLESFIGSREQKEQKDQKEQKEKQDR